MENVRDYRMCVANPRLIKIEQGSPNFPSIVGELTGTRLVEEVHYLELENILPVPSLAYIRSPAGSNFTFVVKEREVMMQVAVAYKILAMSLFKAQQEKAGNDWALKKENRALERANILLRVEVNNLETEKNLNAQLKIYELESANDALVREKEILIDQNKELLAQVESLKQAEAARGALQIGPYAGAAGMGYLHNFPAG